MERWVEEVAECVRRGQLSEEAARGLLGVPANQSLDAWLASRDFGSSDTLMDTGPTPVPVEVRPVQQDRRAQRYSRDGLIGEGGAGSVFLAHDATLHRRVALKALKPDVAARPKARERFAFEAQTTARLNHPGIIPIFDFGTDERGVPYYVMPKVQGRSLLEVLAETKALEPGTTTRYTRPRLLSIFSQVCMTLAYVHDQGYVHRDLKPANVMLGSYGEVYVIDWGLVRPLNAQPPRAEAPARADLTVQGELLGTPRYMAPEQLRGDGTAVGGWTDVYALGLLLFELLTLEPPTKARKYYDIAFERITGEPPDPRRVEGAAVPDELADLVLRACQTQPADRDIDALGLARAIDTFLDGVQEKARRKERARKAFSEAADRADRYRQARLAVADERRLQRRREDAIRPGAPLAEHRAAWRARQALDERELAAEELFTQAIRHASQAIDEVDSAQTHALLADLYWLKAQDAERLRDRSAGLFFRSLVAAHDQGRYQHRLAAVGQLELTLATPETRFTVHRQTPLGPILDSEVAERGDSSGAIALAVGSYVVEVVSADHVPARYPVVVRGDEPARLAIVPPRAFDGHTDFAFVAGGRSVVGGDPEAPGAGPERAVTLNPFFIGRFPITLGQYCAFLDALAQDDPGRAMGHAPRSADGAVIYLDYDPRDRRFSVPALDREGDPWDPEWPALMVSWDDATAYCAWRSAAEGQTYRLPTEDEWEVAARGVDRRLFPWGDGFSPVLCRMAKTTGGRPYPAPVGAHPTDCSPYGVRDLAGGVLEWTATPDAEMEGRYIYRGGGHASPAAWCRAAKRASNVPTFNSIQCGFRIVRAV